MKCTGCMTGHQHCFGEMRDPVCECECRAHTLPEGDVRFKFISLLTAEAHSDYELLMSLINELSEDDRKATLLLAVKYAISTARTYGEDPVQTVRKAALYWAGGTPNEDGD